MGCCRSGVDRYASQENEEEATPHNGRTVGDNTDDDNNIVFSMTPVAVAAPAIMSSPLTPQSLVARSSVVSSYLEPPRVRDMSKVKATIKEALFLGKKHQYDEAYALLDDQPDCQEVETAREVLAICEAHHKEQPSTQLMLAS
ncbi:unnamed protein product [Amoebophrya sp. A25]|nr:unnamed protein product [Amoebophrya sp. A25]|eukprot:GSA25T00010372001.1